jgi:tetratricopeptide (TPR) repeat protein
MPEPMSEVDPRIITALDQLAWGDAADRIEDFFVISPSSDPWVVQYVPILRAAQEGNVEDAAFMLHPGVHENLAPRVVHSRLMLAFARAFEEKQPWIAAGFYAELKDDPRLVERGAQLVRRVQGKPEDIPGKFAEMLAARAQARLAKDPGDAMALQWQAWALVTADPDNAFQTAERAVAIDPTAKQAWMVLAEIGRKIGRNEQAVEAVFSRAAEANAGAAWPFLALAKPISETDFTIGLKYADRALASDPQDWEACELRRKMLRKLERWEELVEQLQYMANLTSDRLKLSELYDEWARTTADPLRDAIGAVELQKQADFFRDPKQVSDFYWKMLAENEKDKRVWDEVDDFFRQNRMWEDLGKLLVMKMERASPSGDTARRSTMGDDRLVFVDQLRIVWSMLPNRGEVAWIDAVQAEVDRAGGDAELKKALEDRLVGVDVPEVAKPAADIAGYVMIAAGVLVVVIVILVAVLLMPFFVQ